MPGEAEINLDRTLVFDPQTSGGLFFAVAPDRADAVQAAFDDATEPLWPVGEAIEGEAGTLEIV